MVSLLYLDLTRKLSLQTCQLRGMFESYKTRGKVAEVQTTLFFVRRGIGGISQVTSVDHCLNYSNTILRSILQYLVPRSHSLKDRV